MSLCAPCPNAFFLTTSIFQPHYFLRCQVRDFALSDMAHSSGPTEPIAYSTKGEVRYLERLELYKTEKPYEVTFAPINITQADVRRTNLSRKPWTVLIRDFSDGRTSFNTDVQGFELDSFPTSLSASELQDTGAIESRYHQEAEAYLTGKYGAKKIFIFDTTVPPPPTPKAAPQQQSVVQWLIKVHRTNIRYERRERWHRRRGTQPRYSRTSRKCALQATVMSVSFTPTGEYTGL